MGQVSMMATSSYIFTGDSSVSSTSTSTESESPPSLTRTSNFIASAVTGASGKMCAPRPYRHSTPTRAGVVIHKEDHFTASGAAAVGGSPTSSTRRAQFE